MLYIIYTNVLQSSFHALTVVQLFTSWVSIHLKGNYSVFKLGGGGMVGVSINTSENQQQTAATTFRNQVIHMKNVGRGENYKVRMD